MAFACLLPVLAAAADNRLAGHPSPYLAMHGQDPVAWQDWGPAALELARTENRLLFISSGYFACHWCHVMQRESFQQTEIAALLNRDFVPVKLDRELHPALDDYLIDFVARTRGQAGWPLNVFLTPDGYPVQGATYLPPAQFADLLRRLSRLWRAQPDKLQELARRAAHESREASLRGSPVHGLPAPADLAKGLRQAALTLGDDLEGGFGRQSRFPMAPQLLALLALQARYPDPELADFLALTLDQIAEQGLRDHLAGGFFRYTVDPSWQVPHFEKMLYTQALLARVFLEAAAVLKRPEYQAVVRQTLDFVLAYMAGNRGGYIASLSAVDADGVEGGAYLWHERELRAALSADELDLAYRHWRLSEPPDLERGKLPRGGDNARLIAADLGVSVEPVQQRIEAVRAKLLAARKLRSLPRDAKQLAAWNGLLLETLVHAARALDEPRYRQAAAGLRDFLVTELWRDSQLLRAREVGRAVGAAALEDYAYVAAGLTAWSELAESPADAQLAERLLRIAWDEFFDARNGGWRPGGESLLPAMPVQPALADGPLPAPSARLIELSHRSGEAPLRQKAALGLALAADSMRDAPLQHASASALAVVAQR